LAPGPTAPTPNRTQVHSRYNSLDLRWQRRVHVRHCYPPRELANGEFETRFCNVCPIWRWPNIGANALRSDWPPSRHVLSLRIDRWRRRTLRQRNDIYGLENDDKIVRKVDHPTWGVLGRTGARFPYCGAKTEAQSPKWSPAAARPVPGRQKRGLQVCISRT